MHLSGKTTRVSEGVLRSYIRLPAREKTAQCR